LVNSTGWGLKNSKYSNFVTTKSIIL
jgi:hypothetical protein